LAGYNSPYQTTAADQEPEDPEVLRLRGISCTDEEIHKLIAWTTRKDFTTWIGISLPIKNFVGEDYHEIQFWEDPAEPIQFEHTAQMVYEWPIFRIRERPGSFNRLPIGMPEAFENLSVVTYRTGNAGYILFTLFDSFADSLRNQPTKVEVCYQWGYTRIGMGDRYTLRMLAMELWTLTRNDWQVYPRAANQTRADNTVCHESTTTAESFHQAFIDSFADPPPKVLVGAARGSSIRNQLDQGLPLQYIACANQAIDVGVAFNVNDFQVESWFNLTLQPQPDDDNLDVYVMALEEMWFERIPTLAPLVAEQIIAANVTNYRFETRYVGNGLKVWFTPADYKDWKPLLESPLVRDKWVTNEAFALSYPNVADEHARKSAELLFNGRFQERCDDPEVQGGKIALIAANGKTVQKPPNCLDRMTSRFLKQVAYNERVLRAEDEIATTNCDIADFCQGCHPPVQLPSALIPDRP
jgi:hypothetical protein